METQDYNINISLDYSYGLFIDYFNNFIDLLF